MKRLIYSGGRLKGGVYSPFLFFLGVGLLVFVNVSSLSAYPVQYKEQYYRLYHLHYIQYPDDTIENIYWLEKALSADFANPLYAAARIENEIQYEKYRYLFMMHLNLKMIEQYLFLGNKWNKRGAYFYNKPWKEQNLKSLETAETCYKAALLYWDDAVEWANKALERRFQFIDLEQIHFWQDEAARIADTTLDYAKTINRELSLLQKVRETFQAMEDD
ncbi:MAG: hypothetical protein LBB43_06040 [Spirochaetaceae bacterium]|jgi:hypothetical protein|nr:hypothetical protein [Spirochaetaceae bacterium]